MTGSSAPSWLLQLPRALDIVTVLIDDGKNELRPAVVIDRRKYSNGLQALRVAIGTKNLKFPERQNIDLIVQNSRLISEFGLAMATRFDVEQWVILPWTTEFFGCWSNRTTPIIGRLSGDSLTDFAWKMYAADIKRPPPD